MSLGHGPELQSRALQCGPAVSGPIASLSVALPGLVFLAVAKPRLASRRPGVLHVAPSALKTEGSLRGAL